MTLPALLVATPVSAAVTLLDFENVSGVPSGGGILSFSSYGGLAWSGAAGSWATVDPEINCLNFGCGLRNAKTSGTYIATILGQSNGTISNSTAWVPVSLQLGAAWYNGLQVTFAGYNGATLVWSDSFLANATGSTLINFNSAQITELRVLGSVTPTSVYLGPGSGPTLVWDDFRVDLSPVNLGGVPEPTSWALMIAGFGLVGGAMRRRSVRVTFA